jgi:nucleotide-binding universal stress UspA family protein
VTDDDRRTLKVVPMVESGVNIAESVVKYAVDNEIDLIVTGTHGRGAVKHFLMGSVAERVVRTAPCPVLTVRSHERDFIAPDALVTAAKA